MNKNVKNNKIELLRFIGIVYIMVGHVHAMGSNIYLPIFDDGWRFVEFFFILSSFLTCKHFDGIREYDIVNAIKISLKYTINKFVKFLPYTILPLITMYAGHNYINIYVKRLSVDILEMLTNFVCELCFLGEFFVNVLFPMWYMSILFIAFPIFVFFIIVFNDYVKIFLSTVFISFYILNNVNYGVHTFSAHFFRCISGLSFGILAYCIYKMVVRYKNYLSKLLLTSLELLSFLCPIIIYPIFSMHYYVLYVLSFMIYIIIAFTDWSYIIINKNIFIDYIASVTLPLYLWHYPIAGILMHINFISQSVKNFICYPLIVIISYVTYLFVAKFDMKFCFKSN